MSLYGNALRMRWKREAFKVTTAESVADGIAQIKLSAPAYAVVDLRLDDGCGLEVISALKQQRSDARAIILDRLRQYRYRRQRCEARRHRLSHQTCGRRTISSSALLAPEGCKAEPPKHPMSADRVRWEHIKNVYEICGRNVSETARRLGMHRRTLQRILAKREPR